MVEDFVMVGIVSSLLRHDELARSGDGRGR